MYALIQNNTITQTRRTLPQTWEHDGTLYDIRPGQHDPADAGWHEVIDTPRPADTDTTTHDRSIELVDGVPTVVWTPRDWTEQEQRDRAEAAAIADLDARLRAVEAHLWPPVADDAPGTDAPTWAELVPPHHWPHGTLLRDGGTVWRNVSGGVLTTPPSGFPAPTSAWDRLFIEHGTQGEPEPDPDPTAPAWSASASYKVGDRVTHDGQVWECLVAHGPEQQGQWQPGVAHTVWTEVRQTN